MLEVHLFVNPLGLGCLQCEKSLLDVDHEIAAKVNYQFIPLLNMQTISETMTLFEQDSQTLSRRNQTAEILMQVALDYEAALFQGRRRARLYLLELQKNLCCNPISYSREMAIQTAKRARLDIDMFLEDRHSQLAAKSFNRHQQLAHSLGIATPSTAVVVDTDDPQYSLLVDNFNMRTLIDAYRSNRLDTQMTPQDLAHQLRLLNCLSSKKHH